MSKVTHWKRFTLIFALALVGLTVLTGSVWAEDVFQGSAIGSGEAIENDVIINGDDVVLNGAVDGDALAIGRIVTVNGDVSGSLIAIAETVIINGSVEGSVYVASSSLELQADSAINRSLYFAGVGLNAEAGSQIGRDLRAISLGAGLSATVGRDVKAVIGIGRIINLILNNIDWKAGRFEARLPSEESAMLAYNQPELISDVEPAMVMEGVHYTGTSDSLRQSEQLSQAQIIGDWFLQRGRQILSFLIVGGLLLWLVPELFGQWVAQAQDRPLASAGYGLVVFVMGNVGVFLLGAIVVGAIGLFLAYIYLGKLALVFWGVGFSGLLFAFSVFVAFVAYISKVIVACLMGEVILRRFSSNAASRKLWPLLLGVIIYALLRAIPVLGWVIGLFVTLLGLGAVWMTYSSKKQTSANV